MLHVAQEDDFGCGVACVAMIVGIPYASALKLFANPNHAKYKGFFGKEIKQSLKRVGILAVCLWASRTTIAPGDIIFIKRSEKYRAGHYIVASKDGYLDPWINLPEYPIKSGIRRELPGEPLFVIKILP